MPGGCVGLSTWHESSAQAKKKKNKTQPQPNAEPFRPSGASCWHGQKAAAAWRWWRASGSGLRSGVVVPCAAQGRGTDLGPLAARRVEMTPAVWAGALASSSRFRQDLVKKLWEPLQRKALAELDAFYPGLLESKKKRGAAADGSTVLILSSKRGASRDEALLGRCMKLLAGLLPMHIRMKQNLLICAPRTCLCPGAAFRALPGCSCRVWWEERGSVQVWARQSPGGLSA